jgi:enoyl-CoA hydratase/carnithine racemase
MRNCPLTRQVLLSEGSLGTLILETIFVGNNMCEYKTISVEVKGGVHWLSLNRPDSLNAINTQMATELRDYFGGLFQDRSCRVVVMRGEGRAYCAGLDIKDHANLVQAPFGGGFGFQGHLADVYIKMRRCPQPIISLIHGAASGGGFAFALASDIRIAGESMKMNSAFIKIGLSSCDMGVSYFLPRLVGLTIASELMMTGRFVNAERALAVGLINQVVADEELMEAAQVYVDEMMATSPMGLRMTKEGLNMAIDAGSLEAAMAIENRNQLMCSASADFKEGLMAFIEKRKPIYKDA